jgi:hypothetical protein
MHLEGGVKDEFLKGSRLESHLRNPTAIYGPLRLNDDRYVILNPSSPVISGQNPIQLTRPLNSRFTKKNHCLPPEKEQGGKEGHNDGNHNLNGPLTFILKKKGKRSKINNPGGP